MSFAAISAFVPVLRHGRSHNGSVGNSGAPHQLRGNGRKRAPAPGVAAGASSRVGRQPGARLVSPETGFERALSRAATQTQPLALRRVRQQNKRGVAGRGHRPLAQPATTPAAVVPALL